MGKGTVSQVLLAESAPRCQEKRRLFSHHRVILPSLCRVFGSRHRVTWEVMHDFIARHTARQEASLAQCENGDRVVVALRRLRVVSPLEVFTQGIIQVLINLLSDYRPENGFDVDMYLVVDQEEDPIMHVDVFPRAVKGKPVTAYGSLLSFEAPLIKRLDERFGNLAPFIFDLCPSADQDEWQAALARVSRWPSWSEEWYITNPLVIDIFMNDAAASLIESSALPITGMPDVAVTEMTRSFGQECARAKLHIVRRGKER